MELSRQTERKRNAPDVYFPPPCSLFSFAVADRTVYVSLPASKTRGTESKPIKTDSAESSSNKRKNCLPKICSKYGNILYAI